MGAEEGGVRVPASGQEEALQGRGQTFGVSGDLRGGEVRVEPAGAGEGELEEEVQERGEEQDQDGEPGDPALPGGFVDRRGGTGRWRAPGRYW